MQVHAGIEKQYKGVERTACLPTHFSSQCFQTVLGIEVHLTQVGVVTILDVDGAQLLAHAHGRHQFFMISSPQTFA